MKIISNFKDYYDHLQGTVGMDEKIIFTRISNKTDIPAFTKLKDWEKSKDKHKTDPVDRFTFHICNVQYLMYQFDGNFYFGEEVFEIPEKFRNHFYNLGDTIKDYHKNKTSLNKDKNCPIILQKNGNTFYKNPKLSDYKIIRLLPPLEIWTMIYDFLIEMPIITDNRTDVEKLQSHGFDKKTSFRKL